MDVQLIARDPHALQQPLSVDTIQSLCVRAFGSQTAIQTIRELGTGSINNTYLLTLHGLPQLILRVAPPPNHPQAFMHEDVLLRQEYQMQPFFAPVASLLPQTVMADFTHQTARSGLSVPDLYSWYAVVRFARPPHHRTANSTVPATWNDHAADSRSDWPSIRCWRRVLSNLE
jgi:hypothetical protein